MDGVAGGQGRDAKSVIGGGTVVAVLAAVGVLFIVVISSSGPAVSGTTPAPPAFVSTGGAD